MIFKRTPSLLLTALIIFFIPSSLYAEKKDWKIRNYQTVRLDTDNEEDHTYLTRFEVSLYKALSDEFDVILELQPFVETRYLWEKEDTERTELGAEMGFHLAKVAYIGEGFHYAWLEKEKDTPEFETRLEINIPFVLNSNGDKVTLSLLEEYTYAAEQNEATRNEIAAHLTIPVFKYLEFLCGWRHIDRIHDYDSDQVELSAIFVF